MSSEGGRLFAVVTSGTHRHVSLDRLRGGFIIIAIENGLVVEMPGSGKALLEPPGWRRVREEVSAFLSSRGVPHYLGGESSVFVDDARGVLEPWRGGSSAGWGGLGWSGTGGARP